MGAGAVFLPIQGGGGSTQREVRCQHAWQRGGGAGDAAAPHTGAVIIIHFQSTIVSEGFKGGTRSAPIIPRHVSLSDSKCWNGGHEWVREMLLHLIQVQSLLGPHIEDMMGL